MIALVTGATAGIGMACAKKFASKNYNLILTGRRKERLKELKKELEDNHGISVVILCFDIRNKEEVQLALDSLENGWNRIDVLVNNAGLALGKEGFHHANLEDFEVMLDTNVKGLLYVAKWVVNGMKEREEGHIINLSSTAAKEVYPGGHVYCATKHAVDAITKGMRIDLLPYNIKVSTVSPGMVHTEFSKVRFGGDESKANAVYQGFTPLYAEDVADAIFYIVNLPKHVNVNDLVMTCTAQANSYITFKG